MRGKGQHVGNHAAVREHLAPGWQVASTNVSSRRPWTTMACTLAWNAGPASASVAPDVGEVSARSAVEVVGMALRWRRPTSPSARRAARATSGRWGRRRCHRPRSRRERPAVRGSSRPHSTTSRPTSQTWWSTIRVKRSIAVTFRCAGTRRPPGGVKWTWLGASSRGAGGPGTPAGRRQPERPGEGPGERLVAGVAGFDGHPQEVVVGGDAAGTPRARAARGGAWRPGARRLRRRPGGRSGTGTGAAGLPTRAVGVVVVEAVGEDVEEPGEGVGCRRGHGPDAPIWGRCRLDRHCWK